MNVFTLGGYDIDRFGRDGEELIWLPDTLDDYDPDYMHWSVDLPSFKVNNRVIESTSGYAIVDTGTSYMRVPTHDFWLLATAIQDRGDGSKR